MRSGVFLQAMEGDTHTPGANRLPRGPLAADRERPARGRAETVSQDGGKMNGHSVLSSLFAAVAARC